MTTLLALLCVLHAAATALSPPPDYVRVPGGLAHASCVHALPPAQLLRQAALTPCAHPPLRASGGHGSAWKAWVQASAPGSGAAAVTALNSTWRVPSAPQGGDEGQVLFFWNGIEPADTSAVLQPVLQWGPSAAGGGAFWAYSAWYVSAAHGSYFSPLVQVAPGDSVLGTCAFDAAAGAWAIAAAAPGHDASVLRFAPVPGAPWSTAYHVLEAYGVGADCSAYPAQGAVNFTGVAVEVDGRPVQPVAWQAQAQGAGCGERAQADAAGDAVQILFNTARY
jgi:hypothetical protein